MKTNKPRFEILSDSRTLLLIGVVCLLTCPVAMRFDLAIDFQNLFTQLRGDIRKAINFCEVFAHGVGVAMILGSIGFLLPRSWKSLLHVSVLAYGAGIAADGFKLLVVRMRPNAHESFLLRPENSGGIEWIAPWSDHPIFNTAFHSFPSAHSATVIGLAVGLSAYFAPIRPLAILYAILAILQRLLVGAHYPSDALAGIAIACFWCVLFTDRRFLGRCFVSAQKER